MRPLAKGAMEGRRGDHDKEGRHCHRQQHQARPLSQDSHPRRCHPWHRRQVPRPTLGPILVCGVSSSQVKPYGTLWDLLSKSASRVGWLCTGIVVGGVLNVVPMGVIGEGNGLSFVVIFA